MDERERFLAGFVPGVVRSAIDVDRGADPYAATVTAAAFAADIVGSTALGELLDRTHDQGSDVLSRALQEMYLEFDRLVHSHGGDLIHIAGDGIFAVWPTENAAGLSDAVAAATACALDVIDEVSGVQVDADHRLTFRVGVAAGDWWMPFVGGASQRAALFGGDPVRDLADALDVAQPGEVLVSPDALATGAPITGTATGRFTRAHAASSTYSASRDAPATDPSAHVLAHVASRADAGLFGGFAELRGLTSVFVKVRNTDTTDAAALGRLHGITVAFQDAVAVREGAVTVTLLDENGLTLVGTWGGSGHAHEDNETRALLAATEFAAAIDDDDVGVGVSTGTTFMGDMVAPHSRRFLILGSAINRAARLAAMDPGREVRADLSTMLGARRDLRFEELPPVHLKGVPGETRLFRPAGRRRADRRGDGLVGREAEMAILDGALGRLGSGSVESVFVEGEAGIGKSALVNRLVERSSNRPVRRLHLTGSSLEKSTPLHPWQVLFSDALSRIEADEALDAVFPADDPYLPLLSQLIGRPIPPTPESSGLGPSERSELTRAMAGRLFAHVTRGSPLLLVAEDAHWFDSASWALVEEVVHHADDALVVIVSRPIADADGSAVRLRSGAVRVPLGPLGRDETIALACERLDVAAVPDGFAALVLERSEGNPLFTEEIVRAMRDAGVVEIDSTTREVQVRWDAARVTAVPSSVTGVIASRVDRLPIEQQLTLKVASVIGRSFTASELLSIHPERPPVRVLANQLDDMVAAGLLHAAEDDPDGFRFAHALTAEATYGLLTADDRADLHGRYASTLTQPNAADDAVLAHHHEAAGDVRAAEEALDRAATTAFEAAAHREAVDLLGRLERLDGIDPDPFVLARRASMAGRSRVALGDLRLGKEHLLAATSHAGMSMPSSGTALAFGLMGQVTRQILHRLSPLPRMVDPSPRADGIAEGAAAYFSMATVDYGLDPNSWLYVCLRCTNEAERIAPSRSLADGYAFLSYALGLVGREGVSQRYLARALEVAEAIDSPSAAGDALLFNAVMRLSTAQWDEAFSYLDRAIARFDDAGSRRMRAQSLAVRGFCHLHRGEFGEALAIYGTIEELETDDRLALSWQLRGTAQAHLRRGHLTDAVGRLEALRSIADEVGERPTILSTAGLLALALWQQGRHDAAIRIAEEGLALMEGVEALAAAHSVDGYVSVTRVLLEAAGRSGTTSASLAERSVKSLEKASRRLLIAQPRARMSRGVLAARAGRTAVARKAFEVARTQASELGLAYEAALIEFEAGRALGESAWVDESAERFSAIGAAEDARIAQAF